MRKKWELVKSRFFFMVCLETGIKNRIFLLFMTLLSNHEDNFFSAFCCSETAVRQNRVLSCYIFYCKTKQVSIGTITPGFSINCRSFLKHFQLLALNNSTLLEASKWILVEKENFILWILFWPFVCWLWSHNYGQIAELLEDSISWQVVQTNHNVVKRTTKQKNKPY